MNPGRNVSVGFTYITGATAGTEKRINCIGLWTIWDLIKVNLDINLGN